MKKINFENLPSQNTPISAGDLNQMQSNIEESAVIVSSTEPTTSEKVWIQKSNNIFNINKYKLNPKTAYNNSGEEVSWSGYHGIYDFLPVREKTTYTISFDASVSELYKVVVFYDRSKNVLSTSAGGGYSFTTPENCAYIRFTVNISTLPSWFQIEQGTAATPYEAYVEPKIYVKNDNGVYEEFYKKNDLQTNMRTIWKGNCYTTGSANTQITNENFEEGKLYLFVVQGNSGTFRMTIPYVYGSGNSLQYAYYDGTTVVRWRIIINATKTGFYLEDGSLNMGSNTGILEIYKVE